MVRSRRGHTSTLDIEEAFIMAIHDNNQAFTYDLKDQLIGAQGDAYGSFEWEYDALGNRTQEVHGDTTIAYSYGTGNNRLVSEAFGDTVNSYSYDYAGSMTRKDYYYEQSLLGGSTYNNNDDSRLTSVAQSGVVETNYYDHLGQRVLKDDAGAHTVYVYDIFGNLIGEYIPGTDAVREWIYLGSHRLAMLHANMSVGLNPPECGGLPEPPGGCSRMIPEEGEQSSAPFNWVMIGLCPVMTYGGFKYRKKKKILLLIFASGVGIIAFMMTRKAKPQTSPEEAVYYYHNDHLGTPKVLTDGDGDVVWEAVMEPFGAISSTLVSEIDQPFRFPGQYDDEWTGMYYNHNRYYIAGLGRYNRVDPNDSTNEIYLYVGNNPLIYIDILALAECKVVGGEYTRLTYYTNRGISGITKSGYPAGSNTVAVNMNLYKLKWKDPRKLVEQGCKWNEFDIPFAGRRVALDTGSKVCDNIDVWFQGDSEGRAFLRKLNPKNAKGGEYGMITIYECTDECACKQ